MNTGPPVGPASLSESEALATFAGAGVSMILTDPRLPDNPIAYVNDAFERTIGYGRVEALRRHCRFLQGPRTDPDQVAALREGIAAGREVSVDILNSRADGTPFRDRLMVAPVRDASATSSASRSSSRPRTPAAQEASLARCRRRMRCARSSTGSRTTSP